MRHIILMVALLSLLSCGQGDTKQKELELKKRELDIKQKELELKEKENSQNKTPTDQKHSNDIFYIVNVAPVKTESEAKAKVAELKNNGNSAGYLWIPDYASLSGAQFYSVYVGPFSTQHDCEVATEEYRKKQPTAYGLLVSQDKKRVQINGIGKVTITDNTPSAKVNAKFKIEPGPLTGGGYPSSNISLEFGNKVIYISNIGGEAHLINKSSFTEMRIPKNALSACGNDGHLFNDFFYAVPSKKGVVVYEGGVDESDERSGFHWKKFKEVVK